MLDIDLVEFNKLKQKTEEEYRKIGYAENKIFITQQSC